MKFLFINVTCGNGSTGRICTDIARELEKNGHVVKIAYGRGSVPNQYKKNALRIGNKLDLGIHGIYARLFDKSGFASISATRRFINKIKIYDPDIIHLHNIHGYYINVKLLFDYLKKCNKKIYWTLHDCWPFTGHSVYCDAASCEKWKSGCFRCPQKKLYPKSYKDNSMANWTIKKRLFCNVPNLVIVSPSEWLAKLVKQSFLKDYKTVVIHNGINTKYFYNFKSDFKKRFGLEDKFLILGVASIFDDLKGFDDFIKLSKFIDDSCRIVLVGKILCNSRKLPKNIIHIDRTNDIREMAAIYNASDVFINLTKQDTYPTVNLEAIACGTPVITYDVGGSAEIVRRYGGVVVKKGCIKEIIDAIHNMVKIKVQPNEIDYSISISKYVDIYLNSKNF